MTVRSIGATHPGLMFGAAVSLSSVLLAVVLLASNRGPADPTEVDAELVVATPTASTTPEASASTTPEIPATPSPIPSETAPAPETGPIPAAPGAEPLQVGRVPINPTVATLSVPVRPGTDQSRNGAVASFTSYAVWLIASPAARADPYQVPEVVGGGYLNTADAAQISGMTRGEDPQLPVERGAYRTVGFSGPQETPDQVMVEIATPMKVGSSTRWVILGGVIMWRDGGWRLGSIMPREIPQPTSFAAKDFTDAERAETLPGLGWKLFRTAAAASNTP